MKTYGTACVFFMRYRYHVATKGDDDTSRYDFRVRHASSTVCHYQKKPGEVPSPAPNYMYPDPTFTEHVALNLNLFNRVFGEQVADKKK